MMEKYEMVVNCGGKELDLLKWKERCSNQRQINDVEIDLFLMEKKKAMIIFVKL